MNTAAHGQTAAFDPDQSPEQDQAVGQDSAAADFQAVRRFIPSSKASRKAATRGWEHNDHGLLPVLTLKPGEQRVVRLLPSYADPNASFLQLVYHEWPDFGHGFNRFITVCPKRTHDLLLSETMECPACKAGVGLRNSALVYCLVDGLPHCMKFTPQNLRVLREFKMAGCFDLQTGRQVRLQSDDHWKLSFTMLDPEPLDFGVFEMVVAAGCLHVREWLVRPDKLMSMAQARDGWLKSGAVEPEPGRHKRLVELLPVGTLIRIPWGMKGPVEPAWQNSPFEMMLSPEHLNSLDHGNIGLLCGRDREAIDKGLLDDQVVIGLDADTDAFAEVLLAFNPWLADTFAVTGNRGRKWFFAVGGKEAARCLKNGKLRKDGKEVGDWLASGKQGVVSGLHPSGKLYRHNDRPMLLITVEDFALPDGYTLTSDEQAIGSAREQYLRYKRMTHQNEGEGTMILDLSLLTRVHPVPKGTQAACPACQSEGKDRDGDNLLIYPDGRYSCARFIEGGVMERHEHNQSIYQLVGLNRRSDDED